MQNINQKSLDLNISSGTVVRVILVILFFVILYILKDLLLVLLTAVVIASAVEPATRWFKRYKVPRLPAVIFVYLFVATFVIGVFYFFIPLLINDFSGFAASLPQYIESFESNPFIGEGSFFGTENIVNNISQNTALLEFASGIKDALTGVSGGFFNTLSAVFGGAFSLILIIVVSFYLAVQERGIENFLKIVVPLKHEKYIINLWHRAQNKIGLWIQGQLLLGLLIGIFVYLGLTVLGVKYALLLAIIAAMFELIPVFGPILAAIPAVLLGFFGTGVGIDVTLGFMVLGLYVIIQQFENHLIYPLVVQKVVGVPPLLVIISLIVGAKLAGFLGILLSVPVAAALVEYIHDVDKDKHPELYSENS